MAGKKLTSASRDAILEDVYNTWGNVATILMNKMGAQNERNAVQSLKHNLDMWKDRGMTSADESWLEAGKVYKAGLKQFADVSPTINSFLIMFETVRDAPSATRQYVTQKAAAVDTAVDTTIQAAPAAFSIALIGAAVVAAFMLTR